MMLFCPVTRALCSKVKSVKAGVKPAQTEILTCGLTGEALATLADRKQCPKKPSTQTAGKEVKR